MANFAFDLTQGLNTASLTATSTGVTTDAQAQGLSVDTAAVVSNAITVYQIVGAIAGTATPTLTSKVQESTDGSSNWTDVTGATFTAVTTTNNVQPILVKPTKRYVRTTGTVSGTNPVFEVCTLVVGPRRTQPDNDGGFDTTAAAAN